MNLPTKWRDVLPVHPAAELFPLMSQDELRDLANDIKANGLKVPIVLWHKSVSDTHYYLLDGRNRLDALELNGKNFVSVEEIGWPRIAVKRTCVKDPHRYAASANIHRRHLTAEQKRDLIVALLKAKPDQSNRAVAEQVKVDDKTVAKVRTELEARSEIPNVETRTDTKGRKQPAKHKPAAKQSAQPAEQSALEQFERCVASGEGIGESALECIEIIQRSEDYDASLASDVVEAIDRVIARWSEVKSAALKYAALKQGETGDDDLTIPACLRRV